jgi:hypothetical protein
VASPLCPYIGTPETPERITIRGQPIRRDCPAASPGTGLLPEQDHGQGLLPPAESFEFAVEWPLGGIGLTIVALDGAAIVAAAGRSAYYWPETGKGDQP